MPRGRPQFLTVHPARPVVDHIQAFELDEMGDAVRREPEHLRDLRALDELRPAAC